MSETKNIHFLLNWLVRNISVYKTKQTKQGGSDTSTASASKSRTTCLLISEYIRTKSYYLHETRSNRFMYNVLL